MGLLTENELTDDWALAFAKIPDTCFLCGKGLSVPSIFWMGADDTGSQLWLHPGCALQLSSKLLKDYKDYQLHRNHR